MNGVNLKPAVRLAAPSIPPKQAVANTVWKDKLEDSQVALQIPKSDVAAKLLQRAKVINSEQYCDAQEIAESLNKSIDQVLATSFLTEKQSLLCTEAMALISRGLINEKLAADALSLANAKGLRFAEGLKYFGYGW